MNHETDHPVNSTGAGVLFLCATPIGNMEDITVRVLRTLKKVDIIAAEDTRRTRKILTKYNIRNKIISYNEHNRKEKEPFIIEMLQNGKNVALTTDAGTPGISDPGADLVNAAIREGLKVESLPGPAAFLVALTVSGLNTDSFIFNGFLPRKKGKREELLHDLMDQKRTLIFYEAPHRLIQTLEAIQNALGNREAVLCRELTKKFEEIERGRINDLIERLAAKPPRGEYTLLIQGVSEGSSNDQDNEKSVVNREQIERMIVEMLQKGLSRKDAVSHVTAKYNLRKKDVYSISLKIDNT